MKTRIISGAVLIALVTGVLILGYSVNEIIITFFLSLLAAAAVYELLKNVAGIKEKTAYYTAGVYSFLQVLAFSSATEKFLSAIFCPKVWDSAHEFPTKAYSFISDTLFYLGRPGLLSVTVAVLYFIFAVVMILRNHGKYSLAQIVCLSAMPFIISRGFSFLDSIVIKNTGDTSANGIYYLLLLLNFSAVCDTGAYFTGVFFGKHKLCPNISPKKTVEGAAGGIVWSMIVSVVLMLCFKIDTSKIAVTVILTVPLCIVGMLGDLFASSFKRSVGVKDYGNIIPGHGGILDRFDSILLLSPVVYLLCSYGIL